ncbi:hypothetical protein ASZ90_008887 [hydrocarbon metagenome]|uniref:Uncharacterized protein n=1 Tax=hydrocarbon metagenome TaxID=938273 RepID=A0A0W8FKT5_9ZZZZ
MDIHQPLPVPAGLWRGSRYGQIVTKIYNMSNHKEVTTPFIRRDAEEKIRSLALGFRRYQ